MQTLRIAVIVGASAFLCAFPAYAQDSQSLGDVARQARLQKQQKEAPAKDASAKDASSKDASATSSTAQDAQPPKPPHVFTNDEIPEHVGPTATSARGPQTYSTPDAPSPGNRDARAEQWKSQIRAQKFVPKPGCRHGQICQQRESAGQGQPRPRAAPPQIRQPGP